MPCIASRGEAGLKPIYLNADEGDLPDVTNPQPCETDNPGSQPCVAVWTNAEGQPLSNAQSSRKKRATNEDTQVRSVCLRFNTLRLKVMASCDMRRIPHMPLAWNPSPIHKQLERRCFVSSVSSIKICCRNVTDRRSRVAVGKYCLVNTGSFSFSVIKSFLKQIK